MIFKVGKKERREKPYKIGKEYFVWGKSKEGAVKNLKHFLGKERFEKKIKE
jgi:hypothetical protein